MTRNLRTHASVAIVCVLVGTGVALDGAVPFAQAPGVSANWKDLETWSHILPDTKDTVMGLGVQPSGANGSARIAFTATLLHAAPTAAPQEVIIQLSQLPNMSPNSIRELQLSFLVNERTPRQGSLNLAPRINYPNRDLYQHSLITNMQASLTPAEFLQLAAAEKLKATVLTLDVVFRPDQIKAMQAFADRIHLTTPARRRR